MHLLNFSSAHSAKWVGFSGFFRFGHPKFEAAAIISMCVVMLVTYTESTADMLAVSEMVGKKLTRTTWPAAWPPTACRQCWPGSRTPSRTPPSRRTSAWSA
jgi:xanthine/uracil permease